MITAIIRWSVVNRFFVLLLTAILIGGGLYAVKNTPVDAPINIKVSFISMERKLIQLLKNLKKKQS